jgi:anti-sigma regulatory factor (Ser/Thr protein kinase)
MCWQCEHYLPCDASAASQARQFCAQCLGTALGVSPGATECIDVAILVVSELVTNAVLAGCGHTAMTIDVHHGRVRIGAVDDGQGVPQIQHPSAREDHGRGLQIVERLSLAWGVSPVPSGKLVWADLAVPTELTAALPCRLPDADH